MEKKEILYILVGMQISAATMGNSSPKKLKVAIWSSNPTPEYTARKDKSSNSKRYTYPSVHCSTIYNSQDVETARVPINRWFKKMWLCIHSGILLNHKREWNNAICSNKDGHREYHIKWNKSDRERQLVYCITYMWNLKNNTNESIYKTETDSQTWLTNIWSPKEKGRSRS